MCLSYNSVVFETIAANEVDLLIITEEFLQDGAKWSHRIADTYYDQSNDTYINELRKPGLNGQFYNSSAFDYLEGAACKDRYRQQFITNAGTAFVFLDYDGRAMYGLNESRTLFYNDSGYGNIGTNLYEENYDCKCW